MERYRSFSRYLKEIFGERVHRITVDPGFTCPTRDGSKGTGGCIYCASGSSYDPKKRKMSIEEQIEEGMERARKRYKANKFIVYFQAYTGTYAPADVLKKTYDTVRAFPEVVGMAIGTRPDCISDEILSLIDSYTRNYMVWIEYGLQSSHFKSLRWMERGHGVSDFIFAVMKTRNFPEIKISTHVILGLPTEDLEDMLETADFLASLKIDGVKIHPLHVLKGTKLAKVYDAENFPLFSAEEYADVVVRFLERLHPLTVIQRLTGEAPEELLIAPSWCTFREKQRLLNLIRKRLEDLDTFQGKRCRFST